jgi:hypothetical protein
VDEALRGRLIAHVRSSPTLMTVLDVLRRQGLPDVFVMSGAVYQTAWNALTGRPPDYGIKDYDVGYFDPDTSYEAEDAVVRQIAAAFDEPLRSKVEVRNQARVHLWFPAKFGAPYEPLTDTAEALQRFVCPAFAVGVRLEDDGELTIAAPLGLEDLFGMRLRANPLRGAAADWDRIITSVTTRWPEAVVESSC